MLKVLYSAKSQTFSFFDYKTKRILEFIADVVKITWIKTKERKECRFIRVLSLMNRIHGLNPQKIRNASLNLKSCSKIAIIYGLNEVRIFSLDNPQLHSPLVVTSSSTILGLEWTSAVEFILISKREIQVYRVENNSVKQLEKLSMDVGWYIIMYPQQLLAVYSSLSKINFIQIIPHQGYLTLPTLSLFAEGIHKPIQPVRTQAFFAFMNGNTLLCVFDITNTMIKVFRLESASVQLVKQLNLPVQTCKISIQNSQSMLIVHCLDKKTTFLYDMQTEHPLTYIELDIDYGYDWCVYFQSLVLSNGCVYQLQLDYCYISHQVKRTQGPVESIKFLIKTAPSSDSIDSLMLSFIKDHVSYKDFHLILHLIHKHLPDYTQENILQVINQGSESAQVKSKYLQEYLKLAISTGDSDTLNIEMSLFNYFIESNQIDRLLSLLNAQIIHPTKHLIKKLLDNSSFEPIQSFDLISAVGLHDTVTKLLLQEQQVMTAAEYSIKHCSLTIELALEVLEAALSHQDTCFFLVYRLLDAHGFITDSPYLLDSANLQSKMTQFTLFYREKWSQVVDMELI